jgi:acetolactate synthase I/II/III large subunit
VPEDHERFAGVLDMACNDILWSLLADADLIVAAGFDPVELIKPWTVDTPVLHVDAVPNTDQIYHAEVELIGDIPTILAWIREETTGGSAWPAGSLSAHRRKLADGYRSGALAVRINPTDVVDVLRDAMPRETIVTTDVGSHKLLVGQGWTTYEPRTSLMSNGLSSMGFSVPGAIGAKIANPDRPVLSFVGDGGFAMVPGEVQLASSMELGITIVVFVDRSLNRIELKQQALGYPSTATTIDASDLVSMAEAMGGEGVRVDDVAALERAAAEPGPKDRPRLIEAHVDPSQYQSQF